MSAVEILQFQYPDKRKSHKNIPPEDTIVRDTSTFAVFDGVTLAFNEPYPNPSPAKEAATIGATTIVKYINENRKNPDKLEVLKSAFEISNSKIRYYNEERKVTSQTVDFLNQQYAATVGAFGFIENDIFYFAQLNDCGVMILDPLGNIEVDLISNQQPLQKYLKQRVEEGKYLAGSKEEHVFIRSEVVNNADLEVEGTNANLRLRQRVHELPTCKF